MARPTGPTGPKTSALSLRLTPRTRYGLTLLARVNRQSLGQVVEEALEKAFHAKGPGTLYRKLIGTLEPVDVLDFTWDERPWVRLARLGLLGGELLTGPELRLWHTLWKTPRYWKFGPPLHGPEQIQIAMVHEALAADWNKLSSHAQVGI